jgi:hypothetical protein
MKHCDLLRLSILVSAFRQGCLSVTDMACRAENDVLNMVRRS